MSEEGKNADVDWAAIERDYRANILTTREIGRQQGVSHTAISKRAKRDGWVRDLAPKIRAKAESILAKQEAAKAKPADKATEKQIIEVSANIQVQVIREHRAALSKARRVVDSLFSELEVATDAADILDELAALKRKVKKGQRTDDTATWRLLERMATLSGRADTAKKLVDALRGLVDSERTVYAITPKPGEGEGSLADLINRVMGTGFKPVRENVSH